VRRLVLCNPSPPGASEESPRMVRMWRTPVLGELVMGSIPKWMLARALRRGSTRGDAWSDARIDTVWEQFDQGTQRAILRLVRSAGETMLGSSGPRAPDGSDAAAEAPAAEAPTAEAPTNEAPTNETPTNASPTTIIWGEADPWYPPAVADAHAARLPGATVERIAGAGHWPWLDRPEVVDRVAALLKG
jgi:pimeloyl-ACP methyl ester carboxylesterase